MTRGELKTLIKAEAKILNDSWITPTELNYWINASLRHVYNLLVTCFGNDMGVEENITLTDGTSDYYLPDDLHVLLASHVITSDDPHSAIPMDSITPREQYEYEIHSGSHGQHYSQYKYMLVGRDKIRVLPSSFSSGDTLRIFYIPRFSRLDDDGDDIHYAYPDYWEDYVINDVVARSLAKEGVDNSQYIMRREQIKEEINAEGEFRDINSSDDTIDTFYERVPGYWNRW